MTSTLNLETQSMQHSAFDFFTPRLSPPKDYRQSEPNFENAYICANISQLCYLSSVNAKRMNIGYEEAVRSTLYSWGCSYEDVQKTIFIDSQDIEDIVDDGEDIDDNKKKYITDTQGLIIFHKNTAIIGFRGSEKKVSDWATNFKIRSRELDYTDKPYEHENPLAVIFSKKPRVHRGFLKAFKAILVNPKYHDSVMKQLGAAENVWLTGHSLGGAIAILAANYLLEQVEEEIHVSGVYTFGAPRVGNSHYRDHINDKFKYQYWRFMNDNDPVPDIPFPELIYRYSREGCMLRLNKINGDIDYLRRIDENGERIRIPGKPYRGKFTSVDDHNLGGPGSYCERLFYLVSQNQPNCPEMTFKQLDDQGRIKGITPEISIFQTIDSLLKQGVSEEIIAKSLNVDLEIVRKARNSDFPYSD
ncbi:lipase family protein [Crocosphaera sp.]|uniref:lipase family protein n=1 Tax=Crocosphaera sp. TaxID=2729996 RepID=UPI002611DD37|nr:lipase family protein [Crocosphaera sp.]MDJ0583391.1 lipase family protein [Crocosphaera sp.]